MNELELRLHCQARKTALIKEREPMMPVWRQVSEYIDPMRGRFDSGDDRAKAAARSRAKIINSKATRALRVMTSGFMDGHTSKSRPWFRITTPNPDLAQLQTVKVWCDDVAQRIRDVLARSNFYTALPNFYTERHMFGIAAMACLEDALEVVRFYTFTAGSYAVGLDHRQRVDTFYRTYKLTARQIDQKFSAKLGGGDAEKGRLKLPVTVQQALQGGKGDQVFCIESMVEPNPDARAGYQGAQFRPWRVLDWIDGGQADGHGYLDFGGDYENPILATRWDAIGGDVYSTSPAIDALGDIKQLQYLEGEKLRLIDLLGKPTLALPDYLRDKGVGIDPGGRIYVTPGQTQQKVEPVYVPEPAGVQQIMLEIQTVSNRIDDAFLVNLFLMLESLDDRERTAYEISERKEEKIAMLGPALESLTDEVLDPTIIRVYGIMDRAGLLPPPPQELNGVPLKIEYTSMLAQAQKMAGTTSIERTVQFVAGLFQATGGQRMDLWDKVDLDEAIDQYADRQGAPASMIRDDESVNAMREQAAQMQRMAQMAQLAKPLADVAGAAKTLGEAVPQDGSAAQQFADAASAQS